MGTAWKRETPLQNIAYIAIMGAVNGALSLFLSFVPYSAFLAILVFPVINAIGIYLVKAKWMPLYLFVALAVPFLVTCYDISTTLFYVMPSIVSGFIYGGLSKLKAPLGFNILISTLWTLGATYLSLPIIKLIYEIDMIPSILLALNLESNVIAVELVPSFLFAYAWASTSIIHFVMVFIHEKLRVEIVKWPFEKWVYPCLTIALSIFSLTLAFFNVALCYLSMCLTLFFACFSISNFFKKNKVYVYVILGVLLIISYFAFVCFGSFYGTKTMYCLLSLMFDSIAIASLVSLIPSK